MDSFLHNHQSALDSQREDDAIQYLQDTGVTLILMINNFLWRLIMINLTEDQLTRFINALDKATNNISIQKDDEVYDDLIQLQTILMDKNNYEPTDNEVMSNFGTKWHDGL